MKKKKTVKTYKSHQASAFFMGIFCLLFAGSFALLFIFPSFTVNYSGEEISYNILDILYLGLGSFIKSIFPDVSTDNADKILQYMNEYAGDNVLFKTICGFHSYVALAISILVAASLVFALIVLILGLVWFIRGRILIPKATQTIAHWSNGIYDSCVLLLWGYLYIFSEVLKVAAIPGEVATTSFPYIVLGIQAVLLIVMRIIHALAYKNRVYEKKKKDSVNQAVTQQANNATKPQSSGDDEEVEPEMVPVYNKGLPEGIQIVGDHSFAADDALTNAIIPAGVTSLGNGAFANCHNLELVTIPATVIKIGPNCFYNTPHLKEINYTGTKEDWRTVRRGTNWLVGAGTTTINTADGPIGVNPNQ